MRTVVGVMGGGVANAEAAELARRTGQLIAEAGWVLLNGGRDAGVMAASARGAAEAGGLVVGVLPGDDWECVSPHVDIPVLTGMGDARNAINVLSSRVVIALAGGAGTLSEIALALKAGRHVITLAFPVGGVFATYRAAGQLHEVATPEAAIAAVRAVLGEE